MIVLGFKNYCNNSHSLLCFLKHSLNQILESYHDMQKTTSNSSFRFIIVGGGTGGITTAVRLRRQFPKDSIALIEPSAASLRPTPWGPWLAGVLSLKKSWQTHERGYPQRG